MRYPGAIKSDKLDLTNLERLLHATCQNCAAACMVSVISVHKSRGALQLDLFSLQGLATEITTSRPSSAAQQHEAVLDGFLLYIFS